MPIRSQVFGGGNALASLEKAKQEGIKWQQPAQYGQNYADLYRSASQAGSGLGNAMANAYGSQAGAMGSLGSAMASERGAASGARGMAEAARQGALSNLGSAALGAYGSAAGNAMGAWATNQTAYNKALSDMAAANQYAMSQYGQSRNQALTGLGASYAAAGAGLGAASGLGSMGGGMGAGDFSLMGPEGEVASGYYGSPYAGGGGQLDMSQYAAPAFAGLGRSLDAVIGADIQNRLDAGAREGYGRLDAQHYTSRGEPTRMMGQALSGLMSLADRGAAETRSGMDQFYGSESFGDYSPYTRSVNAGFGGTMGALGGLYDTIGEQYGTAGGQLRDLWKGSLGREQWGTGQSQAAVSPRGVSIGGYYYPAGAPRGRMGVEDANTLPSGKRIGVQGTLPSRRR